MISRGIVFFGQPSKLACDARCHKAWGINTRPREVLSEDPDDYAFLADHELGEAPEDPGTYEGGQGKPKADGDRLNKWCARECERSVITAPGQGEVPPDYSGRHLNCPEKHKELT